MNSSICTNSFFRFLVAFHLFCSFSIFSLWLLDWVLSFKWGAVLRERVRDCLKTKCVIYFMFFVMDANCIRCFFFNNMPNQFSSSIHSDAFFHFSVWQITASCTWLRLSESLSSYSVNNKFQTAFNAACSVFKARWDLRWLRCQFANWCLRNVCSFRELGFPILFCVTSQVSPAADWMLISTQEY